MLFSIIGTNGVSLLKTRPSRFSCVFRTDQAIWPVMVRWLGILLGTLRSTVRAHRELELENLALRQQLPVWTFRVLFVLVVLSHDRRRLVHFNVTEHPTADWSGRQLIDACR